MGTELLGVVRCDKTVGAASVQCPALFQARVQVSAVIDRGGSVDLSLTPIGPYPEGWVRDTFGDTWYCPEHAPIERAR